MRVANESSPHISLITTRALDLHANVKDAHGWPNNMRLATKGAHPIEDPRLDRQGGFIYT